MRIDLHVHSKERSSCGKASEEEQIQAAISAGLQGLAFTDHHQMVQQEHLMELNQKYSCLKIFGGIEITTTNGEDILVFGIHTPALERLDWIYQDLHSFVRAQQGFMILAHPFRYHKEIHIPLVEFPPDAMEINSNNTPVESRETIRSLSSKLKIPLLSNSDGHTSEVIGKYYNILQDEIRDEKDLLYQLREGSITCYPPIE